jgi:hypothetical protein
VARLIDRIRGENWFSTADDRLPPNWRAAVEAEVFQADRDRVVEELWETITWRMKSLRPFVESAVSISADDVAAFAYSQEVPVAWRDWDWTKDFPNLAPPFPRFFVEWARPTAVLAGLPNGDRAANVVLPRSGVLFVGGRRDQAAQCPLRGLAGQGVEYAHWLTFTAFGQFNDEGAGEMGVTAGVLTDGHGRVVGEPVVDNLCPGRGRHDWDVVFRSIVAIGLLAVTFMHCKAGVRLEDVEPPAALNRARVRRGRLPLVRYRTVVIDGLKEVLRTEGRLGEVGFKKALHLVRGHFANYTPDRPLFGHFVGTVFRSAHLRGDRASGRIIKDYEVKRGDGRGEPDA